jgi:hypothetical protein
MLTKEQTRVERDLRKAAAQAAQAASRPEPERPKPEPETSDGFQPLRPLPKALLEPVLPYREGMLPEALRPYLADVAERSRFQFDYLAVAAMSALGSAVGRRCAAFPKRLDDWHEYPNLWAAIIGRPGAMKSPALNAMLSPLRAIESQWATEYQDDLSQYEAALLRAKIQRRGDIARAEKSAKKGEAFDLPNVADPEPPICKRLLTSDATEAKLGELLFQNPHGITVELDELFALHTSIEREPCLREFFLKGWNGKEAHTIDRIGRGTVRLPAVCLTIVGGIQPGRIAPMVSAANHGAGGDGLLQRFQLIAWPTGWDRDWENVDRLPDSKAKQTARELFETLTRMGPDDFPRTGEYSPNGLRFTPEAQERFNEWHTALHATLRGGGLSESLEASLAKSGKAVAGIALLCELADDQDAGAIGIESLNRSLEWLEVSQSHTRRLFGCQQQTEADAADRIRKRIKTGDLTEGFTAREIKQRHWSGLTDAAAVDAGLSILVECGWLRADRIEGGGRPTFRFAINPRASE